MGQYTYAVTRPGQIYLHSHIRTFMGSIRTNMVFAQSEQTALDMFITAEAQTRKKINATIQFLEQQEQVFGITKETLKSMTPGVGNNIISANIDSIRQTIMKYEQDGNLGTLLGGKQASTLKKKMLDALNTSKELDSDKSIAMVAEEVLINYYESPKFLNAIGGIVLDNYAQNIEKVVKEIKGASFKNFRQTISGTTKIKDLIVTKALVKDITKGVTKKIRADTVQKYYLQKKQDLDSLLQQISTFVASNGNSGISNVDSFKKLKSIADSFGTSDKQKGWVLTFYEQLGLLFENVVLAELAANSLELKDEDLTFSENGDNTLSLNRNQRYITSDINIYSKKLQNLNNLAFGITVKSNSEHFSKTTDVDKNFISTILRMGGEGMSDESLDKMFYVLLNARLLQKWAVDDATHNENTDRFTKDKEPSVESLAKFDSLLSLITRSFGYLGNIKSLLGSVIAYGDAQTSGEILSNIVGLNETSSTMAVESIPLILRTPQKVYLTSDILKQMRDSADVSIIRSGGINTKVGVLQQMWQEKFDAIVDLTSISSDRVYKGRQEKVDMSEGSWVVNVNNKEIYKDMGFAVKTFMNYGI